MKPTICFILLAAAALAQSVFPPPPSSSVRGSAITLAGRCIPASNSATAYTCTTTPATTALTTGMEISMIPDVTSGATPTLNLGPGPVSIRDAAGAALATGWLEATYGYTLRYDGTYWRVQEPAPGAAGAKFAGNVGIGTTSPVHNLTVSSANTIITGLDIENTSVGGKRWLLQSVGSAVAGRTGNFEIWNDGVGLGMVINNNRNVGIGTIFATGAPSQKLTVVGPATFYDSSVLGTEIATSDATCTGWTLGAGWACASGVITHTSGGGTATATYTGYTPIIGKLYQLTLTATSRTTGSVTPSVGGVAGAANSVATLATYTIGPATAATVLTLTPTDTFDGSITVNSTGQLSLKAVGGVGAGDLTTFGKASFNSTATASNSALLVGGDWYSGGSGTTTFPQVMIRPLGTTAATTWSTTGTALGINAPAGFTGNFLDFHLNGGTSLFTVDYTGLIQPYGGYKSADGTAGATVTTCTGFKNGLCISGT